VSLLSEPGDVWRFRPSAPGHGWLGPWPFALRLLVCSEKEDPSIENWRRRCSRSKQTASRPAPAIG